MTEEELRKTIDEITYGTKEKNPKRKIVIHTSESGMRALNEAMKKEAERLYKKLFTPEEQFQQDLSDIRKMLYEEETEQEHDGTDERSTDIP